jgi:hypothetical protein
MASLILYITEHCSLCDIAFELLASVPEAAGVTLAVVDIARPGAVSEEAFESLGPRLPVLAISFEAVPDDGQQLDWPFTAQQVAQLLQH